MSITDLNELPLQKLLEIAWKNENITESSASLMLIVEREGPDGIKLFNECRQQMDKFCDSNFQFATRCLLNEYEKRRNPQKNNLNVDIPFPQGN